MDPSIQSFKDFLLYEKIQTVGLFEFSINLLIAAILSTLLAVIYIKFGNSLSNRKIFAKNFVILCITTTFIITVVKSSLALSLGLVGALSIVRFRAAIKEPEELNYLFISIAIGLGMGAQQVMLTITSFILITLFILIQNIFFKKNKVVQKNFVLKITTKEKKFDIQLLTDVLKKYCTSLKLQRVEEEDNFSEINFLLNFKDLEVFIQCKKEINSKFVANVIFYEEENILL
jgi:hypothetical protein|tara:strand:+ start:309 stop:1001 length:693 start_codon:yes stop_codon:yes gene_type:complete